MGLDEVALVSRKYTVARHCTKSSQTPPVPVNYFPARELNTPDPKRGLEGEDSASSAEDSLFIVTITSLVDALDLIITTVPNLSTLK